jgi:hypothetical protein
VWQGSAGDRRPYADLVAKGRLIRRQRITRHYAVTQGSSWAAVVFRLGDFPFPINCEAINRMEVIDGIWTSQQSARLQHISVCKLRN